MGKIWSTILMVTLVFLCSGKFFSSVDTSDRISIDPEYAINYAPVGDPDFQATSDNIGTLMAPAPVTYTITASVSGGHGTVAPIFQNVEAGGTATIYIYPDVGYDISTITDNGTAVPIYKPYDILFIGAPHAVVVTFVPVYFITASAVEGGTISPLGSVEVINNTSRTFSIIPYKGYSIADVIADSVSVKAKLANNAYTFNNVVASHSISATFSASGGTSPFAPYEINDYIMTNTTTMGIYAAQTFTPQVTHTVSLIKLQIDNDRANSGTLTISIRATDPTGSPTGPDLASATIDESSLARNFNIYSFDLGNGYVLQAGSKYAICMHETVESLANMVDTEGKYSGGNYFTSSDGMGWNSYPAYDIWFEEWGQVAPTTLEINISPANGGNVTKQPDQASYDPRALVNLNATANTGWIFSGWSGDLSGNVNPTVVTMNRNKKITALFVQTYAITATVSSSEAQIAGCSVTGTGNYAYNTSVSLQAKAANGWVLSNWTSADIQISNSKVNPLIFAMPAKPVAVIATFAVYVPPPPSGGGGGGGGAPPPPPVIKSVLLSGFNSTTELKVDTSGNVQSTTQLKNEDGYATLDITKNTRLMDAKGKALDTLSAAKLISMAQPPPQAIIITAYEFGPDGAQFNPPLTLTLKYDPKSLPSSVNGDKVTLAYWNGSRWVNVESTLDKVANLVTAQISNFSEYALLAELAPARFALSELKITEDKSSPENPVTIQTTVTNNGGSQGKYTVNLTLNSFGINKREVTLDPGQSATISFELKSLNPGKYIVEINGKVGQFILEEPSAVMAGMLPSPEPVVSAATVPSGTPSPTAADKTAPLAEKTTIPLLWLIIGLIAVLGVVTGIIAIRRR